FERAVERFLREAVVLAQLVRNVADAIRARHVRVARSLGVLRPEVDDDRLARADLAGAHVMADRALRAVRDDELLRRTAVLGEGVLDRELHALGGQRLAVDGERAVRLLRPTEEVARRVHARLGRALRAADSG